MRLAVRSIVDISLQLSLTISSDWLVCKGFASAFGIHGGDDDEPLAAWTCSQRASAIHHRAIRGSKRMTRRSDAPALCG